MILTPDIQDVSGVTIDVTLAFKKVNTNPTTFGKLIGWWTKSDFSHVEIIIGDHWVSSVQGKGVHIKPLRPLPDSYVYHKLENVTLTHEHYLTVSKWIRSQEDTNYDWLGVVLSQFIPLRIDSRSKWFCSELVTKILQLLLVAEVLDLQPHMQSPGDLSRIFGLEK